MIERNLIYCPSLESNPLWKWKAAHGFPDALTGLNELLSVIYGGETRLSALLRELGFEPTQIEQLRDQHLETIVDQFLEVIHKRLTSESGKDTYYQILSRRYGLDGESPAALDSIAQKLGYTPEYLRQLFEEILQRCQTKTAQGDLKKSLKYIAVSELGRMNQRPTRGHVAGKLVRLTDLRAAADVARMDYEAKRLEILKRIQPELDALDSEYKPVLEAAEENLAALETEIKTDVLLHGESVQGGIYRAVYTKGRISWDSKSMEGYAASHPEVLKFRKQGEPTVSLRVVND